MNEVDSQSQEVTLGRYTNPTDQKRKLKMSNAPRFLQIHTLHSYPGTLLNRDDSGYAKRITFGDTTRTRISSQCLKRHWRLAGEATFEAAVKNRWAIQNAGVPSGVRSKEVVGREIIPRANEGINADDKIIDAVTEALLVGLYGKNAAEAKKRQVLFFGNPEIDYLVAKAGEALEKPTADEAKAVIEGFFKDERKNLNALKDGAGVESAMFGRMVTSDPASNRDAAIHVAHALTVHAIEAESDYFTAVDDLRTIGDDEGVGAAMVSDTELTSGLYYGYVVVDIQLLVDNLSGDRAAAAKVVEHLLHLIATVSPGAKKGSTAPYTYAELMLLEFGDEQPRTLANAFRKPVRSSGVDIGTKSLSAMNDYLSRVDSAYGTNNERAHLSAIEGELDGVTSMSLDQLASLAVQKIGQGT